MSNPAPEKIRDNTQIGTWHHVSVSLQLSDDGTSFSPIEGLNTFTSSRYVHTKETSATPVAPIS